MEHFLVHFVQFDTMKRLIFFFFLFMFQFSFGQSINNKIWKGVVYRAGQTIDQGTIIYLNTKNPDEVFTREEIVGEEFYSKKKSTLREKDGKHILHQVVQTKGKKSSKVRWCNFDAPLSYSDETGYLSGDFKSTECRNVLGTIVLFEDIDITEEKSQHWFQQFIQNYKIGLPAPKILKIQRENFVFKPVYFDYDKSDIKPEFHDFLKSIVRTIQGHSDLRVKVTGHTDSDGTFDYNDGLSQRRADAIINFFTSIGLKRDRIVIDFKGERNPVETNQTSEGRRKNRRVDFSFI